MSMSRCSSTVLTVCGRVGLVDDGRMFGCEATVMMSGACPPPAPSVWSAWIGQCRRSRPACPPRTRPRSACRCEWPSSPPAASDTERQASIAGRRRAPVLVQLEPGRAGPPLLHSASSETVLPLPSSTMLTGQASVDSSIRARFHAPGVTVVALVPSAGPVPPPISVVMPPPSASGSCVGEIMCTWQSMPPAVCRISPLPAITSVDGPITRSGWTPSMMSGFARPCRSR